MDEKVLFVLKNETKLLSGLKSMAFIIQMQPVKSNVTWRVKIN